MADRGLTLEQDSVSTKSLFSDAGYNRLFVVKAPQRRYKWTKEQVKQLWVDICNAREKNVPWYFLGTLLLEPLPDQRVSIIDGQQRIATISLLLAVLRDLCQAAGGTRIGVSTYRNSSHALTTVGNRWGIWWSNFRIKTMRNTTN